MRGPTNIRTSTGNTPAQPGLRRFFLSAGFEHDLAASSRAGSLPQGSRAITRLASTTDPLWERACSRWRCISRLNVDCHDAIASKPAPTGGLGFKHKIEEHHRSTVGASLLAMAVGQATMSLQAPAPNRSRLLVRCSHMAARAASGSWRLMALKMASCSKLANCASFPRSA